jgi:hypothetical protein
MLGTKHRSTVSYLRARGESILTLYKRRERPDAAAREPT